MIYSLLMTYSFLMKILVMSNRYKQGINACSMESYKMVELMYVFHKERKKRKEPVFTGKSSYEAGYPNILAQKIIHENLI